MGLLAREIIHENETHKDGYYLIMKILSQVSRLCHFIMILSNHYEIPRILNYCRENIYLPFMRFCAENVFDHFFLFVIRFLKFCGIFCDN